MLFNAESLMIKLFHLPHLLIPNRQYIYIGDAMTFYFIYWAEKRERKKFTGASARNGGDML